MTGPRHAGAFLLVAAATLLGGCKYFDTPEQAEGRCRKQGVGRLPALSGENMRATSEYLLNQYIDGCMVARGFRRDAAGKWTK